MFFFKLRHGYHVVDVNLYLMMDHAMEQSYHGLLISFPSVLQPKRHHFVAESPSLCDEGCLLHVFGCHLDLIVTREIIHEGKDLVLCSVINQNINVGERKVILEDFPFQISVVHTHPYLPVFFRHRDYVSNPLGIRGDN